MRHLRPVPVLLMVAFAVAACSEGPITPLDDAGSLNFKNGNGGPYVLMASGGGKYTLPFGQDQFSFNAKMSADGSVKGRSRYVSSFFEQTFRGNVVCMDLRQLGGADVVVFATDVPTPATAPPFAGPFNVWFVIDNGEGANALPDQLFSDFPPAFTYPGGVFPDDVADSCGLVSLPPPFLFTDLDNGNIQVKP